MLLRFPICFQEASFELTAGNPSASCLFETGKLAVPFSSLNTLADWFAADSGAQMGHASAAMTARYTGEIPLDQVRAEFSTKFGSKNQLLEKPRKWKMRRLRRSFSFRFIR